MKGLIGKKIGMTSIYTEDGQYIACTVLEVGPNTVIQVKSTDTKDGYDALQLGYGERKEKHTSQPLQGHFKKAGVAPARRVKEIRNFDIAKSVGDQITADEVFAEGDKVQVTGTTKGRGFAGVVKRHGFAGVGGATHGQHNRLRAPGSMGACSFPSRVFKGKRLGGRMGGDRVVVKNLKVVKIFADKNLLLIKGAVPGFNGSFIIVEK